MTTHKNDIAIGKYTDDKKVSITVRGPLSEYIEGMARYVMQVEGVHSVLVLRDESVIVAHCDSDVYSDDPEQARIRIRNRCRDYVGDVTGYISNSGEDGNYVDLAEDAIVESSESESPPLRRGEGVGSGG